jgi:hypothetical protein
MRKITHSQKTRRMLAEEYIHIENGGYSFCVYQENPDENFKENEVPFVEIGNDFWHSFSKITLCEKVNPKMLETIGKMFIRAAGALKQIGGCFNNEKNCMLNEELQKLAR